MSRPKLPNLSWRQMRIASAAALTVLLTTASLAPPADAEPAPPTRTALPALDQALTASHHTAGATLTVQADAQAAAHREATAKAHKAKEEREARQRAARAAAREQAKARQAQQQRTDRSSTRPQAAPTATVSGARSYARSRLSAGQYECLSAVVTRESGWNHRAVNPSSGAYGLFQALPPSKMSSAGSDWRTNPLTQMRWGLSYMESRYGSPCGAWNFWQKNRWY